jgi:hypothetical protein
MPTIRLFEDGIPSDVHAELIQHARGRLESFEDGTPLPATFQEEGTI